MSNADPSILILSGARGDTRRYRTFHLYEQALLAGLKCQVSHVTDRQLREKAERASIAIIHRASYDKQVAWLIEDIHSRGGILIQDFDDLIFDPLAFRYINSPDFADPVRAALYQKEMSLNRKTLDACDFAITSTEYLAERIRQTGKSVFIHRNAFSFELQKRSEMAYVNLSSQAGKIVIGYASGTATHNQDFALIKPALQAILKRYHFVELWIVGPLDPGGDWGKLEAQINRIKLVPWQKLPEIQAHFDINLALVRTDNPFGQSKSEIKYVEAALLRIPTIASPIEAFKHAIRPAENSFLADGVDEWERLLETLITQKELRHSTGQNAYQDVMLKYHPEVRARELVETLNLITEQKFVFPSSEAIINQAEVGLPPSFWSSADRSPTLLQRGVYTFRYRNLLTLLGQIWIYIRRMISPIFPYPKTHE